MIWLRWRLCSAPEHRRWREKNRCRRKKPLLSGSNFTAARYFAMRLIILHRISCGLVRGLLVKARSRLHGGKTHQVVFVSATTRRDLTVGALLKTKFAFARNGLPTSEFLRTRAGPRGRTRRVNTPVLRAARHVNICKHPEVKNPEKIPATVKYEICSIIVTFTTKQGSGITHA